MKMTCSTRCALWFAAGVWTLVAQGQTQSAISPADRDAMARSAFATGDNTRAAAALSEAVRLNPFDPVALNNLAVNYAAQGDYQNAVALLERAQRLAPNRTDIVSNLANLKAWMAQDAQFSAGSRSTPQALNLPRAEDTPPQLPPLWAQPSAPLQSAPLQAAVPSPYPQQPVYAGQRGAYPVAPNYPPNQRYAQPAPNPYPQAPAYSGYADPGYAPAANAAPQPEPSAYAQTYPPAYAPAAGVGQARYANVARRARRAAASRASTVPDTAGSDIITERASDSMPHRKKKTPRAPDCPAP